MRISPLALTIVVALPLAAGAMAGCGSGDQPSGGASSTAAGTGSPARQAAGGFTVQSQRDITLATSKYSSGDWEAGASPANLNGLALAYGQPMTVPLATKGGKAATFVLTVLGVKTKVQVQGSSCGGFTGDWYSGYSPERAVGNAAKIQCAGAGFEIRGTNAF